MVRIIGTGTGDGPPVDHKRTFSFSLKEIFLVALIMIYETICFFTVGSVSLILSSILVRFVQHYSVLEKMGVNLLLNEAAVECFLGVIFLPLITSLWESIEREIFIRPAINRAKFYYPFLLANIPAFSSVLLVLYATWNIKTEFLERFNIKMENSLNQSPASAIFRTSTILLDKMGVMKNDDDTAAYRAFDTFQFTFSVIYLTYFVWKWALKRVPIKSYAFSDPALLRLKADIILGIVTFVLAGFFESYPKAEKINAWFHPDVSNVLFAILLAIGAHFFPWADLFDFRNYRPVTSLHHHPPNEEDGEGEQVTAEDKENERFGYWIHGVLFLLSAATLTTIYFKVTQDFIDELKYVIIESGEKLGDARSEKYIQFGTVKEFEKELERLIRWAAFTFRGMFGYTLLLAMRTLIDEHTAQF